MNIVLDQVNANLKMEKLLLIPTGDGHTKLETINQTVIPETNGIALNVQVLKNVPQIVLLMESAKKKTQTHMPFKLQEVNFLLDLSLKDHTLEM